MPRNVLDCEKEGIFYLDGGTGTLLQERGLAPGELPELWNLTCPEEIIAIGKAYYQAGSHAVCTNTFGANALKFDGKEGRPTVEEVVFAAVDCLKQAREAAEGGQTHKFIALDVGPLGRLFAPMGDLPFEEGVELFAQVIRAGVKAGVDLILIETMNDSYETKAAVLAAKENSSLPVFVSNVYDEGGQLMSGASPGHGGHAGGLRGQMSSASTARGPGRCWSCCPGLPPALPHLCWLNPAPAFPGRKGRTVFDISPAEFVQIMSEMVQQGARVVGGCCGTTPEYIRGLVTATTGLAPVEVTPKRRSVISSYTHAVTFGDAPILIGERINPTGKKRFQEALRSRDIGYVLKEGLAQQEQGVQVLDVNVGLRNRTSRLCWPTVFGSCRGSATRPCSWTPPTPPWSGYGLQRQAHGQLGERRPKAWTPSSRW